MYGAAEDFPLTQAGTVALYGDGARLTLKGGTGSGEVNPHSFVNIEQGLDEAGFTVSTKAWLEQYSEVRQKAKKQFSKTLQNKAKEKGQRKASPTRS